MKPPRAPKRSGQFEKWPTTHVIEGKRQELPDPVVVEEPLEIHVDGAPFTVTMRTPGDDLELAAGLLFGEGVVETAADLAALEAAPDAENRVLARLRPGLTFDARSAARSLPSTAACGVCGKTSIDAVFAKGLPLLEPGRPCVSAEVLEALPERMRAAQKLFAKTGGLHAAALFDAAGDLALLCEDVGRHNAVDKAIGARFLAGRIPLADSLLVLSGRAGFEIVQKAARAGVPIVAAVGSPSSLALRTAERVGMTLVGFLRHGRFNLYTHPGRLML